MIPLSLKLKGLFSYRKEMEIDFARLSEAGLFGIFGPVGSGKSTILEAISLALYGESDRLGGRGSRNYNLMNLQSDEMTVEYRFSHGGEEYLFSVKGNRNSRNFESVRNLERRAHRRENGTWVPLNEANRAYSAEEILGLSYRNFRKTVIVPQGKFMEFLQLGPADRSNMMSELFHLDRYDLYNAARVLRDADSARLQVLEGRLEQLEGVDEEAETGLQKKLEELTQREISLREQRETFSLKLKLLDEAAEIEKELCLLRDSHSLLETQRDEMAARRLALEEYAKCEGLFAAMLEGLGERTHEYDEMRRNLRALAERTDLLDERHQALQKEHEDLRRRYDRREQLRLRISRLGLLAEIGEWEADRRDQEKKLEALKNEKDRIDQEREKTEAEAGKLKREIDDLRQSLHFFTETEGLESWYQEEKNLLSRGKDLDTRSQEVSARVNDRRKRLEDLITDFCRKALTTPRGELVPGVLPPELESGLEKLCGDLKNALQIAPEKIEAPDFEAIQGNLEKCIAERRMRSFGENDEQVLKRLRSTLKMGEVCPVCGSTEHPALFSLETEAAAGASVGASVGATAGQTDESTAESKMNPKDQEDSNNPDIPEALRDEMLRFRGTLEAEIPVLRGEAERKKDLAARAELLGEELSSHRKAFRWERFAPDGEEKFRRESEELHGKNLELREKSERFGELEKKLAEAAESGARVQTGITSLEKEELLNRDRISRAEKDLPEEFKKEFSGASAEDLREEVDRLNGEDQRVEKEYARLDKELRELSDELNQSRGLMRGRQSSLRDAASKIRSLAKRGAGNLAESSYSNFNEVKKILHAAIDVPEERAAIEAYHHKLENTLERITELGRRIDNIDIAYSPEIHEQTRRELGDCEQVMEATHQSIGAVRNDLEKMKTDLEVKSRCEKDHRELSIRLDNLKILLKLFTGKGFINFVAGRYLHELCERANERFFSLAHKQLRLELDSENEFVIRDFMNGGRLRSLKTLSGGQLFQASFSLALALADGIHQNEEGFFFLDEGFGSLDNQALQDVFATLKTLRKENRIVGIISHVEQLRDEIPVFLEVRNTPEEGSVVTARSD